MAARPSAPRVCFGGVRQNTKTRKHGPARGGKTRKHRNTGPPRGPNKHGKHQTRSQFSLYVSPSHPRIRARPSILFASRGVSTALVRATCGSGEALAWVIASDAPFTSPDHGYTSGAHGEPWSTHTCVFKHCQQTRHSSYMYVIARTATGLHVHVRPPRLEIS